MKALIINHEYPPLGAGAANATHYLARKLTTLNVKVIILTSYFKNLQKLETAGEDMVIKRCFAFRKNAIAPTMKEICFFIIFGIFSGIVAMTRYKPHIIHAFFGFPGGAVALVLNKIFKTPYIISLRGSDVPYYDPQRFGVLHPLYKKIIKIIWSNSRKTIANSVFLKNLAQKTHRKMDIKVIPNGVDTDQFCPVSSGLEEKQNVRLLSVGQLIHRKGLQNLIRIMPRILSNTPHKVVVDVVGEGPYENHLKTLVKNLGLAECFHFIGWVRHEELAKWYQQAHIFILLSYAEGMPNVVLEAMACGLPLVVTRIPGCEELVRYGENGLLVEIDEPKSLFKALVRLINEKELRLKMGSSSRKLIMEHFDWLQVARQYQKVYIDIIR